MIFGKGESMRILLLSLLFTFTSCFNTDIVYGNSSVVTVADTLENFEGAVIIDLECPVVIDSGAPVVSLTLDENLHRYISVNSDGGIIHICKNSEYELTMTALSVHLSLPVLSNLTLYQGRVVSNLALSDSVNLALRGTSYFKGEVSDPKASISISDGARSEIRGSVTECVLSVTSNEQNSFDSLLTYKTIADINRTVDTKLQVFNELHGVLDGSGDLLISTAPVVTTIKTNGTGTVQYSVDSE